MERRRGFSELRLNLQALKVAGYPLERGRLRTAWCLMCVLPYAVFQLLAVAKFAVSERTLIRSLMTASVATNTVQILFKFAFFASRRHRVHKFLQKLNEPPSEAEEVSQLLSLEADMRRRSEKRTRRFSGTVFLYNGATLLFGVIVPLLQRLVEVALCRAAERATCEEPLYVYEIWWPSEIHDTPTAYYLVSWHVFVASVYFTAFSTADAFVCSLMLAVAERGSVLARAAPECLRPGPGGAVTSQSRAWVRYHQYYLGLVRSMNTLVNPVVFVVHVFAVLNIITALYFYAKFADSDHGSISLSVMAGFVIQILGYCLAGQRMLDVSGELSRSVQKTSESVHGDSEGLGSGPALSTLQLVAMRCSGSVPERVSVAGLFTLAIDLFTAVVSACVSYFLFLLELCNCAGAYQKYGD